MVTDSNGVALKRILEEELQLAQKLYEALLHEKSCLAKNEVEQLEQSTRQKEQLLQQLEKSAQARQQLIPSHSDKSMTQWIGQYESPLKESLLEDWARLESQIAKCQEQNDINGTVININIHNTRRIFDILFGRKDRVITYDKTGARQAKSDGQSHIKV